MGIGEYAARANREISVLIQIENQPALDHLEELLEVPGIDLAYLGPGDLSQALGVTGELSHPKVIQAMERVVEACRKRGIPVGTLALDPESWNRWRSGASAF